MYQRYRDRIDRTIVSLRRVPAICSLAKLPPGVADKIRVEQVNAVAILVSVMSLMGLGTVLLLVDEFQDIEGHLSLAILGGSVVCCYLVLIFTCLRWMRGRFGPAIQNAERVRQWFARVCFVLGAAWGILFTDLMRVAYDDRRSLLYALIIGLMSAGALIVPASVALAFWTPVMVAGFVATGLVSGVHDYSEAVLLVGYTLLTLFCMLYLNRAMILRVLGEVEQHEGRETIGLLLRDFEESASDWLWETDADGHLTYVSQRFAQAAQTNVAMLRGVKLTTVLRLQDVEPAGEPARRITDRPPLARLMSQRLPFRDIEVAFEIGPELMWWSLTGKPKFSARDEFEGYRGVGSDVTEARRATDRAQFLAHYDELTGLANRRLFHEVVDVHCQKPKAPPVALLCLDLDRFKAINDTHGHPVGDALLVAVARRLEDQIGGADFCARLGGDEFAVVLRNGDPEAVSSAAGRIVAELSKPYRVEGIRVEIGISVGIALASLELPSSEAILRNADAALYQAKADGRGTARFYDRDLRERDLRRRTLQDDLQGAIERGELHVEYQPIFDIAQGQIRAVEALVRWARQPHETLEAGDFVQLAENCGLIDGLGELVLSRACQDALALPDAIRLAVNVSPLQLHGRRFIDHLRRVLAISGLNPNRLELELTETAFFEMSPPALDLLREVRSLGVRVNLDDFGVGHTSLGQLRRFPFDTIKIDQSFVQDLPANTSARVIVRGLTSMAAELGIRTIGEGVETEQQLDLVREAGCGEAQGFFLARPMKLPSVVQLIASRSQSAHAEDRRNADRRLRPVLAARA